MMELKLKLLVPILLIFFKLFTSYFQIYDIPSFIIPTPVDILNKFNFKFKLPINLDINIDKYIIF